MRVSLPEQVWIDYHPASFGSRSVAFAIDFFIRWLAIVIALLLFMISANITAPSFGVMLEESWKDLFDHASQIQFALLGIFFFLVEWLYSLYFEVLRQGVTPGKRALGLRVVDQRGLPITPRASLLRTALRVVDMIGAGLPALISMSITDKSQRLGDLVARTLVVHEAKADLLESLGADESADRHLIALELYNALQSYLQRRHQLLPEAWMQTRRRLVAALAKHHPEHLPAGTAVERIGDDWLISFAAKAQPIKQSTVVRRSDLSLDWKALLADLNVTDEVFDKAAEQKELSPAYISQLAKAYRQVCQHYAYLSTFYPKTKEAVTAARLVRKARRFIYANRLDVLTQDTRPFISRVPLSFHELKWHSLIAFGFLFTAGLFTFILIVISPGMALHFLDEETTANVVEGHMWTDRIRGLSAVASSQIMTNNITVTVSAFALGITLVGTVLVLVINGAMLTGVFSALAQHDMAYKLFDFVVAHGFLEISAIVTAAGAGLYLGDGVLNPGHLSRMASLQQRARAAIDLMLFNALCLVAAGIVEGFISPYAQIPFSVKLGLGLSLGAGYWTYLLCSQSAKPLKL